MHLCVCGIIHKIPRHPFSSIVVHCCSSCSRPQLMASPFFLSDCTHIVFSEAKERNIHCPAYLNFFRYFFAGVSWVLWKYLCKYFQKVTPLFLRFSASTVTLSGFAGGEYLPLTASKGPAFPFPSATLRTSSAHPRWIPHFSSRLRSETTKSP